MKVHEFEILVNKLQLKTRNSYDRLAWFEHEGKTVTRTRRSHGAGDLLEHFIRQQLKLNQKDFSGLISCKLYRDDYIRILSEKGLIAPKKDAASN
jgi:hypothetical protein